MMSTFSGLNVTEGQKKEIRMVNGQVVNLKYPVSVVDHYRYRGSVENHNALRHDGGTKSQIGLQIAQGKTWWPIWGFLFFAACTEVNAYLEMKYLLKRDNTFMNFKKKWLRRWQINNSYMNQNTCGSPSKTRKRQISHILETARTHATEYKKIITEKYKYQ